jgi:CubicO group peptidase (beta-lactamase class C family)
VLAVLGCGSPSGRATRGSQVVRPSNTSIDTTALAAFADSIARGGFGYIDGMLVVRDGRPVFARMFPRSYEGVYAMTEPPGPFNYHDPNWHPYYHGTSLHTQQSVTKSVTSIVYGIALARGDLASIDQPIASYFPEHARAFSDPRKRQITIRHLLTMSSGIRWPEGGSYDISEDLTGRMEKSSDWVSLVLEQPMEATPGEHWSYSSGAAALLAAVFKAATGRDLQDYAREHLFGPLGIDRFLWKRSAGGLTDSEGGLYLDIHDMATLGQLYLQKGQWRGRQIVPAQWVEESVVPHFQRERDAYRYGRLWWMMPPNVLQDTTEFHADGYGGQYIVVLPRWRTVAVMTGWNLDRRPVRPADFATRVEGAVATTQ